MSFSHGVDLDPFSNSESTDSDIMSPPSPSNNAASPAPPASSAANASSSNAGDARRNSLPQYSIGAAFGPSPGFAPRESTRGSVFDRERIISQESSASHVRSRANSFQSNFDPEDGDFDNFIDQTTFEVAREFEPSSVAHKFTEKEREKMKVFETIDYWEPHTKIYKRHIETTPTPPLWAKWFAFFWIGAVVGIIAFVLKQTIDVTFSSRSKYTDELIEHKNAGAAWIFTVAHSCGLILISCCLCVFIEPVAAGSGVPEVMGYLNGVRIPRLLHFRVALVKFFSCVTAVASGLPVGPEGPMIHLGACVGAGVSQGRSKTLRFTSSITRMFRNSQDKRDFITCGVAAGVSAAFSSPTGGLLFTMEELSSFWPRALTWRIFFGTMVSTFAVNLFMSAFHAWKYLGDIGKWSDEATILLNVHSAISFNVYAVPAVVLLGAICGVMAAVFNAVNLRISRLRLAYINTPYRRILEALFITVVWTTIAFTLPYAVDCKAMQTSDFPSPEDAKFEEPLRSFNCPENEYNPLASLLLEPGHTAVQHLFSRQNSHQFGYSAVALFFAAYFLFACISAGTAISSGLIIPTLVMGSSIGRLFGLAMVDIFGSNADGTSMIDAGVFSLFGAAAFFSGLSRLTVSLVVIMVEMSNDTRLLLPVMLGIMVSKGVGDLCTHALYHALLEIKCVPFLDPEIALPKIECFAIKDVMARDVKSVPRVIQVRKLVELLENCAHNGFPVVVPSVYKPTKPSDGTLRRRTVAKSPALRAASPSSPVLAPLAGSVASDVSGRTAPSLSFVSENPESPSSALPSKPRGALRSRDPRQFKGMIRRSTLEVLLRHPKKPFFHKSKLKAMQSSNKSDSLGSLDPNNPAFYSTRNMLSGAVAPVVSYSEMVEFDEHEYALNKRRKIQGADSQLSKEVRNRAVIRESLSAEEMEMYIDLGPYIDTAAFCVPGDFSLQMAYLTFRHMGLRHLTVVNDEHEVIGIITRKDLIGQVIEERLRERQMERQLAAGGKPFLPGSSSALSIPNSDSESSFSSSRIGPSASVYYRASPHSNASGQDGLTAPLLSDPSMDS